MPISALLVLAAMGLPWLGALLVWAVGDERPTLQHTLAAAFSLAGGVCALALLPLHSDQIVFQLPMGASFGDLAFIPDGLGVFLAAIAAGVGSLAVVFSIDYMRGEAQLGRYYFFVLAFIGAMVGLVLTSSLLFLFIFWEITALCSYALISFYNDDPKAVAGGIKALLITQLGGVGLLVGALTVYAYTGSFSIPVFLERALLLPPAVLATLGFGFLIAAAAKSAQVPFHTWLPDAMEAPTPVSALIHAATMVNAGVYLLARFYPAFAEVPGWRVAVILVGAVTVLLAALMAMVANDLKRVLAYSTVSQLGYMVYAVGSGAIFAAQFHLLSHSLFKALLFLGAGAVIHTVGTRDLRQMGGLGPRLPLIRGVFVIGALALAGLPILNGFWSKELILEAGLKDGPAWAYAIVLFGAGLTAFYTYRMVWKVFYGPPHPYPHLHDAGRWMRAALLPLALATLTTWLLAGPLSRLLAESLPFHTLHPESTLAVMLEIVTAPATFLALAVIALGLLAWHSRARLEGLAHLLAAPARWAQDGFGFEAIQRAIVSFTRQQAEALSILQTGQVSWNVVGIVTGLFLVLAWLVLVN